MATERRRCSSLKGTDWLVHVNVQPDGSLTAAPDRIQLFLLWEIAEELRRLNRLLGCRNFTGLPATLRAIQRNTAKTRKPTKPPKAVPR